MENNPEQRLEKILDLRNYIHYLGDEIEMENSKGDIYIVALLVDCQNRAIKELDHLVEGRSK